MKHRNTHLQEVRGECEVVGAEVLHAHVEEGDVGGGEEAGGGAVRRRGLAVVPWCRGAKQRDATVVHAVRRREVLVLVLG